MNRFLYCPIGEPQQQFGVYITGAGHERTLPGEAYPHEYHSSDYYFTWSHGRTLADNEYQLLYIRSGSGVIEFVRGKSIRLAGGSVIILHPGEWHRYRPDPKVGWDEAYIGFGGDFVKRIIAKPFFDMSPIVLQVPPDGKFDRELMDLIDRIQRFSVQSPYSLAMAALSLIATTFESVPRQSNGAASYPAIRRAHLYIGHHLSEVVDFAALAKHVGMSYALFRKRFVEYTGMAPLAYQNALRIRRASHLLSNSDTPISQIAAETGFNSPAYFARFFHHATGASPSQYRQQSG